MFQRAKDSLQIVISEQLTVRYKEYKIQKTPEGALYISFSRGLIDLGNDIANVDDLIEALGIFKKRIVKAQRKT
jgi:hypothetical protein